MDHVRPLSADGLRVPGLLAGGLSRVQVVVRLGWTHERVRDVLADAITALGAGSPLEAIIIAMRHRLR
jgi:hypothetical protein